MGKFTTLEKSQLTKNWEIEERSALAHFLEERQLDGGESLFEQQSSDRCIFFISSGLIRLTYENIHLDLAEGESLAELSLLHQTKKLASAVAVKNSVVYFLTFEKWVQLRRVTPIVSLKLIESISQKLASLLGNSVPPPKLFSSNVK